MSLVCALNSARLCDGCMMCYDMGNEGDTDIEPYALDDKDFDLYY